MAAQESAKLQVKLSWQYLAGFMEYGSPSWDA